MSKDAGQCRFDDSGEALWQGLFTPTLDSAQLVLLTEACRIVDRLDKLDSLITGDAESWIDIIATRADPEIAEVVINKPLAEARQQALVLKQLLAELRQVRAAGASDEEGGEDDELAARRAARIASTPRR